MEVEGKGRVFFFLRTQTHTAVLPALFRFSLLFFSIDEKVVEGEAAKKKC